MIPVANLGTASEEKLWKRVQYMRKLFENVPKEKLKFPNNRCVRNAWNVYEPSHETEALISEIGRNVYAEAFEFGPTQGIKDLRILALQCLVATYKGGQFGQHLPDNDRILFGEHLDIELHVQDLVDLDNDTYWRRVAEAKCKNKYILQKAAQNDVFNWKRLAIASKLSEIIENTLVEEWDEVKLAEIAKKIQRHVYELNILQMKPLCDISLEKSLYNPLYKIHNYPPQDCHHGNLGVIFAELHNLISVSIKFGNEIEQYAYERRHFDLSYQDIQQLVNGLAQLQQLQRFSLHRSFLDDRKCKILMRGLIHCQLIEIDLSYCHLTDDAGKPIGQFLMENSTLKRLELRGNDIGASGCQAIGYGMQHFNGSLDYIGLASNPIGEHGVLSIGGGFCQSENIREIDFSGCNVNADAAFRMAQIVGFHRHISWMDLCSVPLGRSGGEKLVENVERNKSVLYLECRGCGLTENQERKIKILLERNQFLNEKPLIDKEFVTEADAEEIDEWIQLVKHPILVKVMSLKPTSDSCDVLQRKSKFDFDTYPICVPENQRRVDSNFEILGIDIDGYLSDNDDSSSLLNADEPDQFDEHDFVEHVIM